MIPIVVPQHKLKTIFDVTLIFLIKFHNFHKIFFNVLIMFLLIFLKRVKKWLTPLNRFHVFICEVIHTKLNSEE